MTDSYPEDVRTVLEPRPLAVWVPWVLRSRCRAVSGSEPQVEGAWAAWNSNLKGGTWRGQQGRHIIVYWIISCNHACHRRRGNVTPSFTDNRRSRCVKELTFQEICLNAIAYEFPVNPSRFVDTKHALQPLKQTNSWSCHYANNIMKSWRIISCCIWSYCFKRCGSLSTRRVVLLSLTLPHVTFCACVNVWLSRC